jgi:hypothetical protein
VLGFVVQTGLWLDFAPSQVQPTGFGRGMPSAVKPLRIASWICISATCRSKSRADKR